MQVFTPLSLGGFGKCQCDKMQQLPSPVRACTRAQLCPSCFSSMQPCSLTPTQRYRDCSFCLAWKDWFYEALSVLQEWLCVKASPVSNYFTANYTREGKEGQTTTFLCYNPFDLHNISFRAWQKKLLHLNLLPVLTESSDTYWQQKERPALRATCCGTLHSLNYI